MKPFKFDKNTTELFTAITSLKNTQEAEMFFRDLCTIDELKSMAERWQIVLLLNKNMPYRQIAAKLKTSTTTVARVALWLNNGEGGYELILKRLNKTSHQTSSTLARKELR
jgi:TrpR-related protein YerC/YecD